jgi:hypothetical protein
MNRRWRQGSRIAGVALLLGPLAIPRGPAAKVTAEEVVSRHLESIGTAEARGGVNSRLAQGSCVLKILQGGSGEQSGQASLISEGHKILLKMDLGSTRYPQELLAFDGEKVNAPPVLPGMRSRLGDFAYNYAVIVREGLFGGVLSTAWPLLDVAGRQAKLNYQGVKKIEGRELHQLEYQARRGASDLAIRLYFEPETFRHVMTVYDLSVSPTLGATPEQSVRQHMSHYKIKETFAGFQTTPAGLTLPTTWTIEFTTAPGSAASSVWEWDVAFTNITHNQKVEAAVFNPR